MAYFFQTAGELCLSPVGMSLVNKLAPKKLFGMMFGIWFVASAIGNYSSGAISSMMDFLSLSAFFSISVVIGLVGALMAFLFSPMLNKWMHGVK
jgi:POT family proton-dependent oligopeptide transporter